MKTIKIVTNLPEPIQEVKVKKLFSHMGINFAYIIRPYIYNVGSEEVFEYPSIVEVSTGMKADGFAPFGVKTMKSRIENFIGWLDKNLTEEKFREEIYKYEKIN